MKDWLTRYIQAIVNNPEDVSIELSQGLITVVYSVHVNAEDVGLVKGRRKRLLHALSHLVSLSGSDERKRHVLSVVG